MATLKLASNTYPKPKNHLFAIIQPATVGGYHRRRGKWPARTPEQKEVNDKIDIKFDQVSIDSGAQEQQPAPHKKRQPKIRGVDG